jgi:hypothetical protein
MPNNETRKKRMSNGMKRAMKRPWRVTYRNRLGNRSRKILKNGAEKDELLKKLDKQGSRIYGINNLTDKQIEYYERNGDLHL